MSHEVSAVGSKRLRYAAWVSAFALAACSLGCLVDNDGGGISPLPLYPIHHRWPAWSRQGLIAYWDAGILCVEGGGASRVAPELIGIWILNPRTGERRRLLEGSWGHPAWSPDGQWLAAVSGANGNPQIWVTRTDSVNLIQLTFEGMNATPNWSPDGEWIAYTSNRGGDTRIWLMRPDGSEKHAIAAEAMDPCWSPDGDQIVYVGFVASATYSSEIFIMDADGSNGVRLTHNNADDRSPRFSPDGLHIAYASQQPSGDTLPEIWVMNADGSAPRQLTTRGGSDPSWSPDGTEIVFTPEDWRINTPQNGVLWVIGAETGQGYQLLCKWPERCVQE